VVPPSPTEPVDIRTAEEGRLLETRCSFSAGALLRLHGATRTASRGCDILPGAGSFDAQFEVTVLAIASSVVSIPSAIPESSETSLVAPIPVATRGAKFLEFLRRHPILCLAILTPGIPEYLSTSSPILNLAVNPLWFFLGLAINIGQYTAGALLVREAILRWKKGWASVFLLAAAYGITEEGLGDSTLVNSTHGTDGVLGWFGRYAGVNWVWSTGVIAFHIIYSIGLPILLLGLALPRTRGRSLIGRRGIVVAFLSVAATTAVESWIVYSSDHFWIGVPLLLSALASIAALVYLAYRVPARLLTSPAVSPTLSPRVAILIGFAVFPIAFLLEYLFTATTVPPPLIIAIEVAAFLGLLDVARRGVGRERNEYVLVNLAFGFVLWQCVFGFLLTIGLPYTLPLIAVAVWFFVRLRRRYAPSSAPPRASAASGA
jgi:hypothetical protein